MLNFLELRMLFQPLPTCIHLLVSHGSVLHIDAV